MPNTWVLFRWGELRDKIGSWLRHLMNAVLGILEVENFEGEDRPYCFEKAVVMRHNDGSMGRARKLQVFDLLRCKARSFCIINPAGKGRPLNEREQPIVSLTLLMRRGSRASKNTKAVIDVIDKECARVDSCLVQSKDLNLCGQVRVTTETRVVALPHGAQLTNMLFMDRNSSVMEFFPKGWLELAGVEQYADHWMAQSGLRHQVARWDPLSAEECPPHDDDSPSILTSSRTVKLVTTKPSLQSGQDLSSTKSESAN